MSAPAKHQILVVDDERSVRETVAMLLRSAGYAVITAEDGFGALLELKRALSDVIVSDLNMPQMSGFEFLSVVRRRFPEILVVAMSGAYHHGDAVPGGVIADAFYAKGNANPEELLRIVAEVIQTSVSRASAHRSLSAPIWIPRNGKDANGIPYIVLTCTQCLLSFPLNVMKEVTPDVLETPCIFCGDAVRYIIDFSLSVASPAKQRAKTTSVGGAEKAS